MAAGCVFCQIANHEQQADILYEEPDIIAFLDIAPLNKGHTLLIPTRHYPSITAVPKDVQQRMMNVGSELGRALMRATGNDGFNLLFANGRCAGQVVLHAHLHIIPRYPDDGLVFPARSVTYTDSEEKKEIIGKTRTRVNC